MYPLVVIFGYAILRDDTDIHLLSLPLSVLGVITSGYHSFIQRTETTCSTFACSQIEYELLGLLSIPNQAFIVFLIVTVAILAHTVYSPRD